GSALPRDASPDSHGAGAARRRACRLLLFRTGGAFAPRRASGTARGRLSVGDHRAAGAADGTGLSKLAVESGTALAGRIAWRVAADPHRTGHFRERAFRGAAWRPGAGSGIGAAASAARARRRRSLAGAAAEAARAGLC